MAIGSVDQNLGSLFHHARFEEARGAVAHFVDLVHHSRIDLGITVLNLGLNTICLAESSSKGTDVRPPRGPTYTNACNSCTTGSIEDTTAIFQNEVVALASDHLGEYMIKVSVEHRGLLGTFQHVDTVAVAIGAGRDGHVEIIGVTDWEWRKRFGGRQVRSCLASGRRERRSHILASGNREKRSHIPQACLYTMQRW